MTSRGERKVRELALKRNGEAWDTADVKALIFAFADDQEADHAEAMERLGEVEKQRDVLNRQVMTHITEATVRDRRITNLELQFEDRRKACTPAVKQLIAEEHAKTHAEYVASLQSSDFNSRLVWFFASNLGKFSLVVAGLLAGILLNLAIFGRP